MNSFIALLKARNKEFFRNREDFFWNLIFPLLLIVVLSWIFSGNNKKIFTVGIVGNIPDISNLNFLYYKSVRFIDYSLPDNMPPKEKLLSFLQFYKIDLLIDFNNKEYFLNSQSPKSEVLTVLVESSLKNSNISLVQKQIPGKRFRFLDWIIPGLIGMSMMFSSINGIGFTIIRYRRDGMLKRLKGAPVAVTHFLASQSTARYIFSITTFIIVYGIARPIFHYVMLGTYFNLILFLSLGILCMNSLGLLITSRLKSEEMFSGLMDVISFIMIMFSGVFISLESTPLVIRRISRFLPLTHIIDGVRRIMLEGAGLTEILSNVLILGLMTLIFTGMTYLFFRWE